MFVLSLLLSLMKDQVEHINNFFSISTTAIFDGQEEEILRNIEDGAYSLVYASPESFVGKKSLKEYCKV